MASNMILRIKTLPGKRSEAVDFFGSRFKDTRAFPGCESVVLFTVEGTDEELLLVERWTDDESYDRYLAWRTETGDLALLAAMLAAQPELIRLGETDT